MEKKNNIDFLLKQFDVVLVNELKKLKEPKPIQPDEIDNYIDKWINRTVTLLEWSEMRFKLRDHWDILIQHNLSNEDLTEIFYYQFDLFNQCVNNVVRFKIERLPTYPLSDREDLIKEHLFWIESFLKSIDIKPVLTRLLGRSVYSFKEDDYVNILESVYEVKSKFVNTDKPIKYDINRINPKSPFNESRSYFIASIILKYQSELNKILNEKSIDEKPEKNKGYTNQLTTNQKKVVDQLVNNGHTDSHIYHLLKQNNFFTLTEIEFRDYLNKFHGKKLDVNKRITALKNLTFTTEIKQTFEELQDKYIPKSQ